MESKLIQNKGPKSQDSGTNDLIEEICSRTQASIRGRALEKIVRPASHPYSSVPSNKEELDSYIIARQLFEGPRTQWGRAGLSLFLSLPTARSSFLHGWRRRSSRGQIAVTEVLYVELGSESVQHINSQSSARGSLVSRAAYLPNTK
jgi:hypothetical protein